MVLAAIPSPQVRCEKSRMSRMKGIVLMELLLLGLAGLGGLALLLQQKPLPNQADVEKALDKLDKNPADPDANTVAGKYKAFVMGDYAAAMPYLAQSGDKTLKGLAEHELDAGYTLMATDKVVMGDEWVAAAKKFPALAPIFYGRAAQWYVKAWPDLPEAWKLKARERGRSLSSSRPPGGARKGMPSGWLESAGINGRPSNLDGAIAKTGSYSVRLTPPDEKAPAGSASTLRNDFTPIPVRPIEVIAYTRSDGTDNGTDRVALGFFDANGNPLAFHQALLPVDLPFWTPVMIKATPPANAVRAQIEFWQYSKKGNIWVDDVSIKADGKELAKNGSFEER